MRTLLLLATAAAFAWMADDAQAQQTRTERRVVVIQPDAPADAEVYRDGADRVITERDYRGRWTGEWQGEWDRDGRRYEGRYEGEYERDGRMAPPPHGRPHMERHERRVYDWNEMERMCRRDDGIGGAAIGGVAGGLIGNRVAGRGNRTVGTAVGAVAGAAAGAAIDRAEDRRACEAYWQHRDGARRGGYTTYGGDYGYDYGDYGYGTVTTVIPGAPVIVEETETTYETVTVPIARQRARVAPRRHVVRARPRPRPRCTCR